MFDVCVIQTERSKPLTECLIAVGNKYGSDEVLKNWVSSIYPLQSDYWTFRKTVSDILRIRIVIHLSLTNIVFSLLNITHYFVSLSMHLTLSNWSPRCWILTKVMEWLLLYTIHLIWVKFMVSISVNSTFWIHLWLCIKKQYLYHCRKLSSKSYNTFSSNTKFDQVYYALS